MAMTTTSSEKEKQEKTVKHEFFHIDMIPDAMEKMGWVMAPKLMRHWFSIYPAYAFTKESKTIVLNNNAVDLSGSQVNTDIIKMQWAIGYEQVRTGITELSRRWKSPAGIDRLRRLLKNKGDYNKESIVLGYTENVKELDSFAQINLLGIGELFDTVNDWYGAIGNANLKICVRGKSGIRNNSPVFFLEKIGFYLKDTYDFVDEGITPEPLGIWSKNRILNKIETGLYMSSYLPNSHAEWLIDFSGFVPVFNDDFRKWQKKHNTGGDFMVFSDVLWIQPDINEREIYL